jgi:hypothetical protein
VPQDRAPLDACLLDSPPAVAKKSLRSQLNQIRAWVRQGRTEAWIAHQLEVPASELRDFVRKHDLSAEGDDSGDVDLRDEIEAEIEASMDAEPEEEEEAEEEAEEDEGARDEGTGGEREGGRRRRRRRRRSRRTGVGLEATFDHGEKEGYGLWLDPAVADDPVYEEHWKGHRQVEVTVEADRIVIRRSGEE